VTSARTCTSYSVVYGFDFLFFVMWFGNIINIVDVTAIGYF
jgi:hypothetical protein